MSAELIVPREEYRASYLEACREFKARGILSYSFDDPDTFGGRKDTLFEKYEDQRLGRNLPEGFVPSSAFWLVEGGACIGAGNIRHRLTGSLEKFGGHIGCAIRPGKWGMGCGTLQLRLLLKEAATPGIKRALITCDEDNIASARVIEKNGGVYRDTVVVMIGGRPRRTKRYWAETPV